MLIKLLGINEARAWFESCEEDMNLLFENLYHEFQSVLE